jgi:hypothetical protein
LNSRNYQHDYKNICKFWLENNIPASLGNCFVIVILIVPLSHLPRAWDVIDNLVARVLIPVGYLYPGKGKLAD